MKENLKKEVKLISNGKEFKKLLKTEEKLLVLFSNDSCGYCQMAENNIKKILDSFEDLILYKLKLSDAPEIFAEYNINSAPVTKVFIDQKSAYTAFGIRPPSDLYYQLKPFFKSSDSYFKEIAKNN
ncbi:thioredoxin family protein [Halanaerobium sp. Z-7514]|uniref:Thioredoxin family protein n=1 Tax=Halanaerobium polyolivorans TaxID=2886943 RepID=A0AAW4WY07_9FIRM|nr:thioredoxin family protein [Halanaerobium polyolivorans]MCC3143910.1 thioredoxin family protein [Halanaerobium polyolivorans]RQD77944.1 MAG: thioredoxin [Halanaerobium sp. MSAO_Bac5]